MVDTTTTAAATPPQQRAAGARIEKSEPRAEGTGRRPRVATRAASTLTTAPCTRAPMPAAILAHAAQATSERASATALRMYTDRCATHQWCGVSMP